MQSSKRYQRTAGSTSDRRPWWLLTTSDGAVFPLAQPARSCCGGLLQAFWAWHRSGDINPKPLSCAGTASARRPTRRWAHWRWAAPMARAPTAASSRRRMPNSAGTTTACRATMRRMRTRVWGWTRPTRTPSPAPRSRKPGPAGWGHGVQAAMCPTVWHALCIDTRPARKSPDPGCTRAPFGAEYRITDVTGRRGAEVVGGCCTHKAYVKLGMGVRAWPHAHTDIELCRADPCACMAELCDEWVLANAVP